MLIEVVLDEGEFVRRFRGKDALDKAKMLVANLPTSIDADDIGVFELNNLDGAIAYYSVPEFERIAMDG